MKFEELLIEINLQKQTKKKEKNILLSEAVIWHAIEVLNAGVWKKSKSRLQADRLFKIVVHRLDFHLHNF